MVVSNSPEIFQEKMNEIFRRFEFIRAYIDNLLIITWIDWSNHLEKMELIKRNIKKFFFGQTNMEYPGFWMTRNGIQLINNIYKS